MRWPEALVERWLAQSGHAPAAGGEGRAEIPNVRDLLTPKKAARLLGLSPSTLRRMGEEGRLPAVHLGGTRWRF